jgi:hypothetical protein
MDKVRVRFSFLPSSSEEREAGIVRLKVNPNYKNILHSYGLEHRSTLGDQFAVFEPYTWHYSTEAIRFFHKVRDMILEKQSGPDAVRSKTEKDHLKKQLKEEFGPDKSLKEYTRSELWHLVQGAVQWLYEAGGDLGSLRVDFEELKQ